jgi:TnpA family transposase
MPIRTRWHDADHMIIFQEYTDSWDVDEYLAVSIEIQQMMDSVDHVVHLIGVVKSKTMPDDILIRLHEINRSSPLGHSRMGLGVIVTTVPLVRSIVHIYGMVYRPLHLVESVEGAEQIIEEWHLAR